MPIAEYCNPYNIAGEGYDEHLFVEVDDDGKEIGPSDECLRCGYWRATPKPTALERIRPLIESGEIRACTRSGKPMTEGDAAVLLEFHDLLSKQPAKNTTPKENH